MARRHALLMLVLVLALAPRIAPAQPGGDASGDNSRSASPRGQGQSLGADQAVRDAVAETLLARASELHGRGDHAGAKKLLIESLELCSTGARAAEARSLLGAVNEKLGVRERMGGAPSSDGEDPLDPYGSTTGDEGPLDPYGEPALGAEDGNPSDGDQEALAPLGPEQREDPHLGRRLLMTSGALYGFTAGMALAGPLDDQDELRGGAVLAGALGAAGGITLAYLANKKYALSHGQAMAVSWATAWGATEIGFFTDLVTGIDESTSNQIYKGVALGGLAGLGAGALLIRTYDPSAGDVVVTSSFGLYGMSAGLLLGVAIQPPETEAYSINAMLGSAVGLGVGMYAARRLDASPRRMFYVDIAAAAGALAPWILIYPLLDDGSDLDGSDSGAAAGTTGLLSALTMLGGAYIGWKLTAKIDRDNSLGVDAGSEEIAAVPGLLQRKSNGSWGAGLPLLKPAENPALAPPTGSFGLTMDLVGGRF